MESELDRSFRELAEWTQPPLCGTCEGWMTVDIACDVISRCIVAGKCPDCTNGYAGS